jgi:hypothetical protein
MFGKPSHLTDTAHWSYDRHQCQDAKVDDAAGVCDTIRDQQGFNFVAPTQETYMYQTRTGPSARSLENTNVYTVSQGPVPDSVSPRAPAMP